MWRATSIFLIAVTALAMVLGLCRRNWPYSGTGPLSKDIFMVTRTNAGEVLDPEHPCGAVSLCLVAQWLRSPVELAVSTRSIQADSLGRTTMSELVEGIQSMGFEAEPVRLGNGALQRVSLPMILFVRKSHFVAALPTGANAVVFVDPPYQPEVISEDKLRSVAQWSGEALLVARGSEPMMETLVRLGVRKD